MAAAAKLLGVNCRKIFTPAAKHYGLYKPNQGLSGITKLKNVDTQRKKLEEMCSKHTRQSGQRLRQLLIICRIREDKCEICGQLPFWKGKKLTLQIDHKDGDHRNNHIDNLSIICPNCHSQTSTFCSSNKTQFKYSSLKNLPDEDIHEACANSKSQSEAMIKLNLNVNNYNQRTLLKNFMKTYNYIFDKPEKTIIIIKKAKEYKKAFDLEILKKLQNSGIDFSKFGWVQKAAPIIGVTPQAVSRWLKSRFSDFYFEKCFTRKLML